MTADQAELIAEGQKALAAEDWDRAGEAFEAAIKHAQAGEALDGLAWVSFWRGDYASSIQLREQAYLEFERQGQLRPAAKIACWLAYLHFALDGNLPVALGWYTRAERLAAEAGDCAERGWVKLLRAGILRDPKKRQLAAREAMEIGRRLGDRDLEFDALSELGEALVRAGSIEQGMSCLDESMAAVTAGEVRELTAVGDIYCSLLSACDRAGDLKRAEQWMQAVDKFLNRLAYLGASAICRSHYGRVLTLVGRWKEAEKELVMALQLYETSYRTLRQSAVLGLADLRLRQGRIEEAEQLLAGGDDDLESLPILIGLQLARGETDLARARIERYLAHRSDPDVFAAPLIALGVDVYLASQQLAAAEALVAQLEQIAVESGNFQATAIAAAAAGRAALKKGEPSVRHFERALLAFAQVEMPLEQARTRLDLAQALAPQNPSAAIAEARLAMKTFQGLSATRDLDSAAQFLRELGAGGRTWAKGFGTLTGRETEVLQLLGTGLSNPQIAERLFLSRRTVEHHVANILSKLGLATRSEAAAYAVSRLPRDRAAR